MGDAGRRLAAVAGLAVLVIALAPPVDAVADRDLVAHMVQHVLLLTVAPPLLVAGARLRRPARAGVMLGAVVAHTVALLGWHVPALYDAAVRSAPVHGLEHLSLLAAGLLLWWAIGVGGERVPGSGALAVFAVALPGTALGFALTFAPHPWYAAYPSLADQQVAGIIMWAVAGTLYALAGGGLAAWWLARDGDVAADAEMRSGV